MWILIEINFVIASKTRIKWRIWDWKWVRTKGTGKWNQEALLSQGWTIIFLGSVGQFSGYEWFFSLTFRSFMVSLVGSRTCAWPGQRKALGLVHFPRTFSAVFALQKFIFGNCAIDTRHQKMVWSLRCIQSRLVDNVFWTSQSKRPLNQSRWITNPSTANPHNEGVPCARTVRELYRIPSLNEKK